MSQVKPSFPQWRCSTWRDFLVKNSLNLGPSLFRRHLRPSMLQQLLRRLVFDVPLLTDYCKMPLRVGYDCVLSSRPFLIAPPPGVLLLSHFASGLPRFPESSCRRAAVKSKTEVFVYELFIRSDSFLGPAQLTLLCCLQKIFMDVFVLCYT